MEQKQAEEEMYLEESSRELYKTFIRVRDPLNKLANEDWVMSKWQEEDQKIVPNMFHQAMVGVRIIDKLEKIPYYDFKDGQWIEKRDDSLKMIKQHIAANYLIKPHTKSMLRRNDPNNPIMKFLSPEEEKETEEGKASKAIRALAEKVGIKKE